MPVTTGQQGSSVNLTCACRAKRNHQSTGKGTYQWQLFDYWSDDFRHTNAEHSAYIALNFAGVLDVCRSKLYTLIQHHRQHLADAKGGKCHSRAYPATAKHHVRRRHVVRRLLSSARTGLKRHLEKRWLSLLRRASTKTPPPHRLPVSCSQPADIAQIVQGPGGLRLANGCQRES